MRVFLSHSTKDKGFVEKLAGRLEAEEIGPWLCEVDMDIGHDVPVEISKGLEECELVVLVWSPEAAASRWTPSRDRKMCDKMELLGTFHAEARRAKGNKDVLLGGPGDLA